MFAILTNFREHGSAFRKLTIAHMVSNFTSFMEPVEFSLNLTNYILRCIVILYFYRGTGFASAVDSQ
jgi:hypothetical protein